MTEPALPICHQPVIRAYLRHAYLFSILGTRDDYLPWVLSGNYTQLVFDPDPGWMPLDFYTPHGYTRAAFACPFLDTQWMDRNLAVRGSEAASRFLVDVLGQGYYAAFTADEFHIPGRAAYQRTHFKHSVLVYGYDGGRFSIMGYDDTGNYVASLIDRERMDDAFCFEAGGDDDRQPPRSRSPRSIFDGSGSAAELRRYVFSDSVSNVARNRIWLVRHLPAQRLPFDVELAVQMLADYLTATDTSRRFRLLTMYPDKAPPPHVDASHPRAQYRPVFGVRVYDELIEWLARVARRQCPFTIVPFHLLWEHKLLMHRRLQLIEDRQYLDPARGLSARYRAVVHAAAALKLNLLRRVSRQQLTSSTTVPRALTDLRDLESETLEAVVDAVGDRLESRPCRR